MMFEVGVFFIGVTLVALLVVHLLVPSSEGRQSDRNPVTINVYSNGGENITRPEATGATKTSGATESTGATGATESTMAAEIPIEEPDRTKDWRDAEVTDYND